MSSGLSDRILEELRKQNSSPKTKSELARALGISGKMREELGHALKNLEKSRVLLQTKKGRFVLKETSGGRLLGRIKILRSGKILFIPDLSDEKTAGCGINWTAVRELEIQSARLGMALDGDKVLVTLEREAPPRWKKTNKGHPQESDMVTRVKIEEIVERRRLKFVGIFKRRQKTCCVEITNSNGPQLLDLGVVPEDSASPQDGQFVAAEITSWLSELEVPKGRILEILGWPDSPGADILAILHQYQLAPQFPTEVLDEATKIPEEIAHEERARREDWTDKLVVTIDPKDAKDHDDAIWVQETETGWELAVHIADVSHYVRPGTALDKEAQERGNSTYLVDRVVPMLPFELSANICSLRQGVDRLTKCCHVIFTKKLKIAKMRFVDAIIRSQHSLSYEKAQELLNLSKIAAKKSQKNPPDNAKKSIAKEPEELALTEMLRVAWDLAKRLREKRFAKGALDLEMPEVRVILDEKGKTKGISTASSDESHQLIEEFMLVANEVVALALKDRQRPAIYRVHENPDFAKLFEFGELARLHGYNPGDLSQKVHLQNLIDKFRGSPEEHALKVGLLKSLKRANYKTDPFGHYGLSKTNYCHFTSPIRRYADLVVHRALQHLLANKPQKIDHLPPVAELGKIADHISETERNSSEAEGESKRLKIFEYIENQIHEKEPTKFDAVIVDVRPNGVFLEILSLSVRGMVRREDLPAGHWFFEAHNACFSNRKGQFIRLGQRAEIIPINVDMAKQQANFRFAPETISKPSLSRQQPRSKKSPPAKTSAAKTPPVKSPPAKAQKAKPQQSRPSRPKS